MNIEEVREFFKNDRYATDTTGIRIEEADEGMSRVSLILDERHKNALGHVMGAVYTTMIDFAFAVASNCGGTPTVTLQTSVSFMHSAKGPALEARAERINETGKTCVYRVSVTDEDGTLLTQAVITGYKVRKESH